MSAEEIKADYTDDPHGLPIPPDVAGLPERREILRLWTANGRQYLVIDPAWDDPSVWGIVLSDILTHLCNVYNNAHGLNPHTVRAEVLEVFSIEVRRVTGLERSRPAFPGNVGGGQDDGGNFGGGSVPFKES